MLTGRSMACFHHNPVDTSLQVTNVLADPRAWLMST